MEYRNVIKDEYRALNILHAYFKNKEHFEITKEHITMRWLNGSAWIIKIDNFQISDRLYHNRPRDSGREIINRLSNVHIRNERTTMKEWRRIVHEETNFRTDRRRQRRESKH